MDEEPTGLRRRGLLRAGAVAVGVAAGAAIVGAGDVPRASAETGDAVFVGGDYTANFRATSFTVTNSTTVPAVSLSNEQGPALFLAPLQHELTDQPVTGSIASTADGPLVVVDDAAGQPVTTYLATGIDLAVMPLPVAVVPTRLLDTRTTAGRAKIVQSSAAAFDSQHRLKAGAWLDLAVDSAAADFTVQAAFLNVTATGALSAGYLTTYPPGTRPEVSSVNFGPNQTVANAAFVKVAVVAKTFAVRIYASATTHLIADLSGTTMTAVPGPAAVGAQSAGTHRPTTRRVYAADRKTRTLRRAARRY